MKKVNSLSKMAYGVYQLADKKKYIMKAYATESEAIILMKLLSEREPSGTFIVESKSLQEMWCDLLDEFGINTEEIFGELCS